jgi:protein-disulfide isomerase
MAKKRSTATRRAESQAASARAAAIRKEQERKERRRRSLVVTGVGAVVLLLVLAIGYAVQSSRDTTGASAAAPAGAVGTYSLPVGKASAPATVTVYEDFLCPFCGDFEKASRDWLAQYAADGKVAVRYRVISILDSGSNGTKYSTRAASALAVVLDKSGPEVAKKFHDLLYENQPEEGSDGLSDGRLVDLAVQAGATKSAVEPGIEKRAYEQWVENGTDAATKLKAYQGTPLVLLDGKAFTDYQSIDELSANLKKAVDAKQ